MQPARLRRQARRRRRGEGGRAIAAELGGAGHLLTNALDVAQRFAEVLACHFVVQSTLVGAGCQAGNFRVFLGARRLRRALRVTEVNRECEEAALKTAALHTEETPMRRLAFPGRA